MRISRLPQDDKVNGWSAILTERHPNAALEGDRAADWVVLGAGYAGLAAARRLAENHPDHEIVLIEANRVGENASGRNSGFAIDLPHNVGSSLEELEGSHRYMRLARAAINELEQAVETHKIDCAWSKDGKYHAAVSPRGVKEVLEPFAQELTALGEDFEWVDKADLEKRLGSPHFTSAIYTKGGALMNPAALTRGLAAALPENVTLYENSPVIEANYDNGVHLRTKRGSVRAPKMIMAANGFAEQFGLYSGRFIHVAAFGSLTEPLTDKQREAYGVKDAWGLTPANAFAGITMRYTNDNRILIRQGLGYCPSQYVLKSQLESVQKQHKRLFDQRFPSLKDVNIAHTWSGIVCLSQNHAPAFGKTASNIWSAVCQNAVGVTKGTIGGLLAADMACGIDNPLIADMESLGQPQKLPPQPFMGIGVRARFQWELFRNRHEA